MKRVLLLLIAILSFNLSCWSQPDYTIITFKSKVPAYKRSKPNLKNLKITKSEIKNIITLLGSSFYSESEIDAMTQKTWLTFIDPKQFDYVFKDLAIRTTPNWNKKNVRGKIVVEPNPFQAEWTLASGETPYFKKAFSMILSYYKLMKYSDDAQSAKVALGKLLYTKEMNFRPAKVKDWTNPYLESANQVLVKKGLTALVTSGFYDFFVCEVDKKDELTALFKKMDWKFITP